MTTSQYFRRNHYKQVNTIQPTTTAEVVQAEPRATAQVQVKHGIRAYEWIIGGIVLFVALCLVIFSLTIQMQSQSLVRSTQELTAQTAELHKQSDFLRSQLTEQYNYHSVKQAAEQNGMKLRPDSVKDLTGR